MDISTIQGETRTPGAHHANKRLRSRGLVPAVVYGHGEDPEHVALSRHDLELALGHSAHVINVKIDGGDKQYLIKDVQYDHLQKTVIHVDLMRVSAQEKVQVSIAIELRGEPKGAAEGGQLMHALTELEVECPLMQIPDGVRVSVEHLDINDTIHVRELQVPDGVTVLSDPDEVVAVVHPPRIVEEEAEEEAAPGAEGAEPEVIGKGKEEDEEGDGGES